MQQTTFDWTRAERIGWITQSEMPVGYSAYGEPVAPATLKAFLMSINDRMGENEWAFPSQATLASDLSLSTKTIQRATEAAVAMSLLITQLRKNIYGRVTMHYRIVWTELQMLEPSRRSHWKALIRNSKTNPATTSPTTRSELMVSELVGSVANSQPVISAAQCAPRDRSQARASDSPNSSEPFALVYAPVRRSERQRDRLDNLTDRSDSMDERSDIVSDKPSCIKPILKETPPPRLEPTVRHEPGPDPGKWEEVEEDLLELGVSCAVMAVQSARRRGNSIEHCRELIAYYRARLAQRDHGWQVPHYVLYTRIKTASPRLAVDVGWIGGRAVTTQRPKPKWDFERARNREFMRLRSERLAANGGQLLTPEDLEAINAEAESVARLSEP